MAVYVSPGVYTREIDLSLYIPQISTTIFGIVGEFTKGETETIEVNGEDYKVGKPIFVTSVLDFTMKFGNMNPDYLATYSALQYLRYGHQLVVVRVLGQNSTKAFTEVPIIQGAEIEGTENAPFTFTAGSITGTEDAPFTFGTGTDTFVITSPEKWENPQTFTFQHKEYSLTEVIALINATAYGFVASADSGGTKLKLTATAHTDLTIGTGNANSVLGFTNGSSSSPVDTLELALPQKNGASQKIVFEFKTYTISEIVDYINAIAYNFKAVASGQKVKLVGTYNGNLKIGSGNANTLLGFTANDEATPTTGNVVRVYALSEGDWANGYKIKFTEGSLANTFKMSVYNKDNEVIEVFDYLSYNKNSEKYYTKIIASNYVADFVLNDGEYLVLGTTIYTLDGGVLVSANTSDFVQGLQQLRYPEDIDVNLIAVPSKYDHEIITEMLSIAEERGDCMALIDPPFGFSIQDVIDWHNGKKEPNNSGVAYDSSYGALYYSWLEVYDYVNKQKVWTPPSGFVASMYAYTDLNYELWYAPAGFNRGRLVSALRLEVNPKQGDRDFMYGNGNAVNPICSLPRHGITIYGQRTLQRLPTALDRVNVRRLLLYLRKVIATAVQGLVFEPNDAYTRRRFISLVKPFLEGVQARRGLQDFKIVCDETNNTPDVVERNEMIAYIFLKPTKVAEIIQVVFVLTPQGAKFEEMVI